MSDRDIYIVCVCLCAAGITGVYNPYVDLSRLYADYSKKSTQG